MAVWINQTVALHTCRRESAGGLERGLRWAAVMMVKVGDKPVQVQMSLRRRERRHLLSDSPPPRGFPTNLLDLQVRITNALTFLGID